MCGGTEQDINPELWQAGLSPRVRGNLGVLCVSSDSSGSIPACAGEPTPAPAWTSRAWVYPRVCGGTMGGLAGEERANGLSPRVRGNRMRRRQPTIRKRSIPACAGEPREIAPPLVSRAVYPRVCGGTGLPLGDDAPLPGLSPRVRGNPPSQPESGGWPGSIPACAGGTAYTANGVSNPARSIPACAGEPACPGTRRPNPRVYPRVCGGTPGCAKSRRRAQGLSPRVRGNREPEWTCPHCGGSIPACAGEPRRRRPRTGEYRVYPRVCGGTPYRRCTATTSGGLSPRVRGNRQRPGAAADRPRSIPACAGEPCPA